MQAIKIWSTFVFTPFDIPSETTYQKLPLLGQIKKTGFCKTYKPRIFIASSTTAYTKTTTWELHYIG